MAHTMYQILLGRSETKTPFRGSHAPSLPAWWAFRSNLAISKWVTSLTPFAKVSELGSLLPKQPYIIGVHFRPKHCSLCSVASFAITQPTKQCWCNSS